MDQGGAQLPVADFHSSTYAVRFVSMSAQSGSRISTPSMSLAGAMALASAALTHAALGGPSSPGGPPRSTYSRCVGPRHCTLGDGSGNLIGPGTEADEVGTYALGRLGAGHRVRRIDLGEFAIVVG